LLSAFLIVKNEAVDLPDCLASLKGLADEIVIVDSGSSDDTVTLAKTAGARVLNRVFEGFAAQKQFALEQCTQDWVLSVDADERVSPELAGEIKNVMSQADAADGYELRREMYFLGRRLRDGGVGTDWPLRLFKRAKGKFSKVSVHERVEIDSRVARLEKPLRHFSYATIEEYNAKCDHYTTLSAQDLFKKGRRFSAFDHFRPGWELFQRILLRGAWLDGRPGLIYAALCAHAAWLRAIKLWDLEQRP
jgi:glycosyltransferase involved in cell wall biosynthesis